MRMRIGMLIFIGLFSGSAPAQPTHYPWLGSVKPEQRIIRQIPAPTSFQRILSQPNSFAAWLQHLPLKPGKPPVYLFNGQLKSNQTAHFAVLDIDVGNRDLQQCADAVIRLRAEYFYSRSQFRQIHFNFTSGDETSLLKWQQGYRPKIRGNQVEWKKTAAPDSSYRNFKRYLRTVFTYAGSYSLNKEMKSIDSIEQMQIGDVFIQGGFPGHAVIVVDLAVNSKTGEKLFLLAQSYMPAQQIHILRNPNDPQISPWYPVRFGTTLQTPEWEFQRGDLKRFR